MPPTAYLKIAAVAIVFGAGWTVRGWYGDSLDLAATKAAEVIAAKQEDRESKIASTVEKKLSGLKANERIIERRLQPIINKEIYKIDCVDDDGLDIINGVLSKSEADAGKSVGAMPLRVTQGRVQEWRVHSYRL